MIKFIIDNEIFLGIKTPFLITCVIVILLIIISAIFVRREIK